MTKSKSTSHTPNFDAHPVRVTLCFRNQADRDEFMGGLSDGFGEEFCDLDWAWSRPTDARQPATGFAEATMFTVKVAGDRRGASA